MPRNQLSPGTVVWAHIDYADVEAYKTRPAIVRSVSGRDVTLLPTTSSTSRFRFPDRYLELTDPSEAGLSRATGVRRQSVTIDIIDLVDIVGHLGDHDHQRLFDAVECVVISNAA